MYLTQKWAHSSGCFLLGLHALGRGSGRRNFWPCFCVFEGYTIREQYEYQRAVDAELASAVKTHGKLTTFGVVLQDVDGEVFWLNHNNHHFSDELLHLLDQGAVPMAYMGATTGHLSERHFYAGTLHGALGIIRPRLGELYTLRATVELHLALSEEVALTVTASLVRGFHFVVGVGLG